MCMVRLEISSLRKISPLLTSDTYMIKRRFPPNNKRRSDDLLKRLGNVLNEDGAIISFGCASGAGPEGVAMAKFLNTKTGKRVIAMDVICAYPAGDLPEWAGLSWA